LYKARTEKVSESEKNKEENAGRREERKQVQQGGLGAWSAGATYEDKEIRSEKKKRGVERRD